MAVKPADAMSMATKMTQSVFLPSSPANWVTMGSGWTVGRGVAEAVADAVREEMREEGRGMGSTLLVFMASTIMVAELQLSVRRL